MHLLSLHYHHTYKVLASWIWFSTSVFFFFFPGPFKDFQWANKSPDRYITASLWGWYWGDEGRKEGWRREKREIVR